MNKTMFINKIEKHKNKDKINIIITIQVDKQEYKLSYDLSFIGCDLLYPKDKRIDSTVVTMLLFAMINGYNISSKYPISEKLYYQLVYHIIPQLKKCNKKLTDIIIDAPLDNHVYNGRHVATGISCGIDSLTTIYEYSKLCSLDDYKLTHLVYFKTGAHDGQLGRFDRDVENNLFHSQLKNAIKFCQKYKYPLIIIDSNLNEILTNLFGFTFYERTHTLRNCGTMLLLQEFFSKYYYADTYSLDNFFVNTNEDIAHYEKYLMPLISNESISFYSANKGMSRFEKTKLLTDFEQSYDNLLVCWYEGSNCLECDKCIRTLVSLDILDKLDKYKKSFDLDKYYKNRKKYISRVIALKNVDPFFDDICQHMDKKFRRQKSIVFYILYKVEALLKKIKKHIKRLMYNEK